MEEFVGRIWDRLITRAANTHYPEASVALDDCNRQLAIQFRAFGGDPGLQLLPSNKSDWQAKRSWLSRIARSDHPVELAWLDQQSVRLPSNIALFDSAYLNKKLYLWLTAMAAHAQGINGTWLARNQAIVCATLERLPGLQSTYNDLLKAHLAQRDAFAKMRRRRRRNNAIQLAESEAAIVLALQDPQRSLPAVNQFNQLLPVALWLYPAPNLTAAANMPAAEDDDTDASDDGDTETRDVKEKDRRKAERTDDIDGRDGLLAFRLESVFSWAEFVPVDRTADDDDPDNAEKVAEDLDVLSLAHSGDRPAARLRMDLDLPPGEFASDVLQGGVLLPEWNYRTATLAADFCRLQLVAPRMDESDRLPERIRGPAKRVKAQFERMAQGRQWLRGQMDGEELDLDRYIIHSADRVNRYERDESGLYRQLKANIRDLSCLLLADFSLSTDAWVNNDARVIDIIRDSLHMFNEALSATGDAYAIHGFSSKRRDNVHYYPIKNFGESSSALVRQRINSIEPCDYTRMGAAIRFATERLRKTATKQKLLLILSDGKPNDVDMYEGRYGIEDTRQAIHEAFVAGVRAFCVTVDERGSDYLPYIFGSQNYIVVKRALELPKKLPMLYQQLYH